MTESIVKERELVQQGGSYGFCKTIISNFEDTHPKEKRGLYVAYPLVPTDLLRKFPDRDEPWIYSTDWLPAVIVRAADLAVFANACAEARLNYTQKVLQYAYFYPACIDTINYILLSNAELKARYKPACVEVIRYMRRKLRIAPPRRGQPIAPYYKFTQYFNVTNPDKEDEVYTYRPRSQITEPVDTSRLSTEDDDRDDEDDDEEDTSSEQ